MAKRTAEGDRPTLTRVAEEAGVSVATVSKVVNGRPDVSPRTRARVIRLLLEHHYVARGIGGVQQPVRVVDLAFDRLADPNNLLITRGVTEAAAEAGVDVVIGVIPDDPLGAAWARKIAGAGREGVILGNSRLSPQQWAQFDEYGIPLVLIDPMDPPGERVPSIVVNDFGGSLAATEHLLRLGHRRIAMITGRPGTVCGTARLNGYLAALAAAGITPDPRLVQQEDLRFSPACRTALELLAMDDPPTAFFATDDEQALGVFEAARLRGLRVPTDVSVVGFDDTPAARTSAPPLTTVRRPFDEIGRTALRTLLRLAAGDTLDDHRTELATRLVVRRSTAPRSVPTASAIST